MARLARARSIALCLVVSAVALAGLFELEGRALADRTLAPRADAASAASAASRRAPAGVSSAEPGTAGVAGNAPSAVPPPPPVAGVAEAPAPVATVAVPNLVGLRLTYAANRVERRGLTIVARDENGEPVDLALSQFYRVIGQNVRRGATVASGTVIEVRVRDRAASYSDWG